MIALAAGPDGRRLAAGAGLLVVAATTWFAFAKLVETAFAVAGYPFRLDYGEDIVWQQLIDIVGGHGYAPLGAYPAIVYHYPPVYHLVTASVAAMTGWDALLAGRMVSFAATCATVALIARLALLAMPAGLPRRAHLAAAWVGGLVFTAGPTVIFWSTTMRVDMLACAFTMLGLGWVAESLFAKPGRIPLAAAAFALAVYTKQTAIFAPAAAFVTLLMLSPRNALRFFAWLAAFGAAALGYLMWMTDGEFLRHVMLYNVNRLDPGRWRLLVGTLSSQAQTLAIGLAVATVAWRRLHPLAWRALRERIAADPRDGVLLLALSYLLVRLATVPLILKSGASDNYLIDLFAATTVFVALGLQQCVDAVQGRAAWPPAIILLLVVIGLPIQNLRQSTAHDEVRDAAATAASQALVERIRAADKPVIADNMMLLLRAGRPVAYEPAIVAELSQAGLYDAGAFARLVDRHAFAFFVTDGGPESRFFAERYPPEIAAAIRRAYPVIERHAGMTLRLPR